MDESRYQSEKNKFKHFKYPSKKDNKFFNYRLVQEDEVPYWVQQYTVINISHFI
jgi:hypothetical protein